jgi:hypothetical protein
MAPLAQARRGGRIGSVFSFVWVARKATALPLLPERITLFEHIVSLAEQNDFQLMLLETPRLEGDQNYPAEQKQRTEAFYCGLAQAHRSVLYARMTHMDGIDREPFLYWDWEHFNGIGATKMSQLIAPLITALANRQRTEACLLR